jgi:tetratricopeptide (TPR) repeat protein
MNQPGFDGDEREAQSLEDKGQLRRALEIRQRLAKAQNGSAPFCHLGRLLSELQEWKEAEAAYRKALELQPQLDLAAVGLSISLLNQGEHQEALAQLNRFVDSSENALVHFFRGEALEQLGRNSEAIAAFQKAASLDSRYEEAFYRLGLLLKTTDSLAAREALKRAIDIDDQFAEAYREFGWLLSSESGLAKEAEYCLRRATEINPRDSWAWVYLGNLFWRKGKMASAEEFFLRGSRIGPDEWQTHWALATFYEAQSRRDEAKKHYMRALALAPKEPVALTDFGRSLLRGGESRRALEFLSKALAIDPEYEKARQLLLDAMGLSQSRLLQ